MTDTVTAGMLAIGDELLSGRTKDKNIGHLASMLTAAGIDLKEVRIVADDEPAIVEALNALRDRYTYIFTSGGIGPTHDDITADAVSAAFNVPCIHDERAMALLAASYAKRDLEFTDTRKRMARMPRGSDLIENKISVAPGFKIGNVHVMAGVPSVFEAMLEAVLPTLRGGATMLSVAIPSPLPEGVIGGPLGKVQREHPDTVIGSYPRFTAEGGHSVELVVRSRDPQKMEVAADAVRLMLRELDNPQNRTPTKTG